MFFPYVMIPIIAFDKKCEYSMLAKAALDEKKHKEVKLDKAVPIVKETKTKEKMQIDSRGKTESEKAYGRKISEFN